MNVLIIEEQVMNLKGEEKDTGVGGTCISRNWNDGNTVY